MKKTKARFRWLGMLLAFVLAFGFIPTPTLAATNGEYTVFISFEGYNLGHGFYIEPTAVSVAPGSSALDATVALLEQEGLDFTINDWGFLDRIYGVHPGGAPNPPEYITVELEEGPDDGSIGSNDYAQWSGFMNTVNHYMSDVGAGEFIVSDGDVIRWQFTVGMGDLGLGEDRGAWGEPLYDHADKTQLIRALFAEGARDDAVEAALAVIINPLATDDDVAAALLGLQGQDDAVELITVFVSFEGYNLGHGFYIEPTIVSLPYGSSALDATVALLEQEGLDFTINDWGFLDRIYGVHPGGAPNPPEYITVELEEGPDDGSIGSNDYAQWSGFMNTVNHYMADVGADEFIVSDGDVIRWQFTVGMGDLGLGEDRGAWGESLYDHADKTDLIRALFEDGISEETRQAALAVIINPLATPEEVAAILAEPETVAEDEPEAEDESEAEDEPEVEPEPKDEPETDVALEWANPFADVSASDWFYGYVGFVFTQGLMTGTTADTFAPDANLSKAMAVTLLWRLEGAPTQGTADAFGDVRAGRWYYGAVAWAVANEIVIADGLFAPGQGITAEQFAAMLEAYALALGFEDVAGINGIFADLTLDSAVTRGETAAIMQRFIELVG